MIQNKIHCSKQRLNQLAFSMAAEMPHNLLAYLDPILAHLNNPLSKLNEGASTDDSQDYIAASDQAPAADATCIYSSNAADDAQASNSILRAPQASDSTLSVPQAAHSVLSPTNPHSPCSHPQAVRAVEAHVPQQQDCLGVSAADNADTSPHDRSKAMPTACQSVMCSIHAPGHLPMQAVQPYKTQAAVPNEQGDHLRAHHGAESESLRPDSCVQSKTSRGVDRSGHTAGDSSSVLGDTATFSGDTVSCHPWDINSMLRDAVSMLGLATVALDTPDPDPSSAGDSLKRLSGDALKTPSPAGDVRPHISASTAAILPASGCALSCNDCSLVARLAPSKGLPLPTDDVVQRQTCLFGKPSLPASPVPQLTTQDSHYSSSNSSNSSSSSSSSSNGCIQTARAQHSDSADVYAASGTVHSTAHARCLSTPGSSSNSSTEGPAQHLMNTSNRKKSTCTAPKSWFTETGSSSSSSRWQVGAVQHAAPAQHVVTCASAAPPATTPALPSAAPHATPLPAASSAAPPTIPPAAPPAAPLASSPAAPSAGINPSCPCNCTPYCTLSFTPCAPTCYTPSCASCCSPAWIPCYTPNCTPCCIPCCAPCSAPTCTHGWLSQGKGLNLCLPTGDQGGCSRYSHSRLQKPAAL